MSAICKPDVGEKSSLRVCWETASQQLVDQSLRSGRLVRRATCGAGSWRGDDGHNGQLYHEVLTAERIARDEAGGMRSQLDQLQARGLWARLRNKW